MSISFKRQINEHLPLAPKRVWGRIFVISFFTVFVLLILTLGTAYSYAVYYKNTVYPGVYLGNFPLGGLTKNEVVEVVETTNNQLANQGVSLLIGSQAAKLTLDTVIATDSALEILSIDSNTIADKAMQAGRSKNFLESLLQPLELRFKKQLSLKAPVVIDEPNVRLGLKAILSPLEDVPRNAGIAFKKGSQTIYEIIPENEGYVFNYSEVIDKIVSQLETGNLRGVEINLHKFLPIVTTNDIKEVEYKLPEILGYGSLSFNYIDSRTKARRDWEIKPSTLAAWLIANRDSDHNVIFELDEALVTNYLVEDIKPVIDRRAQDAKFEITGEKVNEFKGSRPGANLDVIKTYQEFASAFTERNYEPELPTKTVSLLVDSIEPQVKTADVNNLGITEILGTGVSSFSGSPRNRIKNITHAAQLLNGTLIKPGEEFSTNDSAGPYTKENGYLPEMVIKGKQIIPEVGGGMCQIGTTLFRMAMNSAMPITERRNHSLVVSFYSDPVNHNPGTDATVYSPIVDFKFLNDTGNYILVQTDVDTKKQDLIFTLWGKPDGRRGSYTHPEVQKWLPIGEKEIIEISDGTLAVGTEKCQNAFRGARASFTYTRFTSSSEKIDRVFSSYYRSLPKICMVGVEPEEEEEQGGTTL
jgi:vancomycin resistance protein YoaR